MRVRLALLIVIALLGCCDPADGGRRQVRSREDSEPVSIAYEAGSAPSRYGEWRYFVESRSTNYSGCFLNDRRHGKWEFYVDEDLDNLQPDGRPTLDIPDELYCLPERHIIECSYRDQKLCGCCTVYDLERRSLMRGELKNGLRDGVWQFWDPSRLRSLEISYVSGQKHGLETEYGASGLKIREGYWSRGRRTGVWTSWDQVLTRMVTWRDDLRHGHGCLHHLTAPF